MIYVKSYYNQLDRKYFGAKINYSYKQIIKKFLTNFTKKYKIQLSAIEKKYIEKDLVSLFTIYRYFDIKLVSLIKNIEKLLLKYLESRELIKQFIIELLDKILKQKGGYTKCQNL